MRPKAGWVARQGRHAPPRRAWLLAELGGAAAALAGIAAAIMIALAPGGPPGPSAAAAAPRPPAPLAPSAAALAKRPAPTAPPVRLQIPAIHVSAAIVGKGLDADGALQVPPITEAGVREAGWYDLGPVPGQAGSAIIAGHVDSYHARGVFYDLGALVPGNAVVVTLADGRKVRFTVTSVQEYTKARFPAGQVYGAEPYPALRLITCGGAFDRATGHYLSNIVAYARMN